MDNAAPFEIRMDIPEGYTIEIIRQSDEHYVGDTSNFKERGWGEVAGISRVWNRQPFSRILSVQPDLRILAMTTDSSWEIFKDVPVDMTDRPACLIDISKTPKEVVTLFGLAMAHEKQSSHFSMNEGLVSVFNMKMKQAARGFSEAGTDRVRDLDFEIGLNRNMEICLADPCTAFMLNLMHSFGYSYSADILLRIRDHYFARMHGWCRIGYLAANHDGCMSQHGIHAPVMRHNRPHWSFSEHGNHNTAQQNLMESIFHVAIQLYPGTSVGLCNRWFLRVIGVYVDAWLAMIYPGTQCGMSILSIRPGDIGDDTRVEMVEFVTSYWTQNEDMELGYPLPVYIVRDRSPFDLTLPTIGDVDINRMREELRGFHQSENYWIERRINAWAAEQNRKGNLGTTDVTTDDMFDALPEYACRENALPDLHDAVLRKRKLGK